MEPQALIDRLAPGARVTDCRPLTGGVSAEVHAVTFVTPAGAAERVVVRRHREVPGKPGRVDRAAREHALLGTLHAHGVAVPDSRLFVPPDTLVIDFVPGDTRLPPNAGAALAAALAAVHRQSLDGLPALPVREDPLPELRAWLPRIAGLETAVRSLGDYAQTPRLLHGDFWPGNVLWHEGRLAAILDWEDAAIGDPLSDVACARVELACAAGPAEAAQFTGTYFELTGLSRRRLPVWDLYVTTAALTYMDQWGLQPDALAARKAVTQVAQARALAELGAGA